MQMRGFCPRQVSSRVSMCVGWFPSRCHRRGFNPLLVKSYIIHVQSSYFDYDFRKNLNFIRFFVSYKWLEFNINSIILKNGRKQLFSGYKSSVAKRLIVLTEVRALIRLMLMRLWHPQLFGCFARLKRIGRIMRWGRRRMGIL